MASRRRRRAVTWLPTLGTAGPVETNDNASGRAFSLDTPPDGTTEVAITALTFDVPRDADSAALTIDTLADIIGSEYMLRRIVGKCFANSLLDSEGPAAILFGAGFFVARAADEQQAQEGNQPIGSQSPSERVENYNPLSDDCIREPWIWRRVWILGRDGAGEGAPSFPSTTVGYGSVQDGPHIDAQTMRRVGNDERLWFAVAARNFPIAVASTSPGQIFGYLDYRLLGSLLKARNRGVF